MLAEAGGGDEDLANQLRESYGLNKPIHIQLFYYLTQVLKGDLGYSFYYNEPVTTLLAQHLPTTILLTISSLIVAVILQLFYNYLVSKIDSLVNTMEDASISLVDILVKNKLSK